jgi:hypothetical protein
MRCSICRSPRRKEIDAALLQGARFRDLARDAGVGKDSLVRHRDRHLPARLVKAQQAAEIATADVLAAELAALDSKAGQLGDEAERSGDWRGALLAVRERTRICELKARLAGELRGERVAVNVNLSPEAAQKMAEVYLARRGHLIEMETR